MLFKATSANHEKRFGRISCIKVTAAFAAKALHPFITTFGNFQKFGYSAGNFDSIRRDDRDGAKWCATDFWQSVQWQAMILSDDTSLQS